MVYSASTRIPPQKRCGRKIDLGKGVLIPPYDYDRAVPIEQQDVRLWVCREEKGFESEIEVRVR